MIRCVVLINRAVLIHCIDQYTVWYGYTAVLLLSCSLDLLYRCPPLLLPTLVDHAIYTAPASYRTDRSAFRPPRGVLSVYGTALHCTALHWALFSAGSCRLGQACGRPGGVQGEGGVAAWGDGVAAGFLCGCLAQRCARVVGVRPGNLITRIILQGYGLYSVYCMATTAHG